MISIISLGVIAISALLWVLFIYFIYCIVQNIIGEQMYGVVIGQNEQWDEGEVYFPIIEYQYQGITQQFQSTISAHKPFIVGTQIRLVRHVRSGTVECRDAGRLSIGAIMILFLALLWTAAAIAIVSTE